MAYQKVNEFHIKVKDVRVVATIRLCRTFLTWKLDLWNGLSNTVFGLKYGLQLQKRGCYIFSIVAVNKFW